MAVEWRETEGLSAARVEIDLAISVIPLAPDGPGWIWLVADDDDVYRGEQPTEAAAKSAALAEARRLLAQAMEELGDG